MSKQGANRPVSGKVSASKKNQARPVANPNLGTSAKTPKAQTVLGGKAYYGAGSTPRIGG